MSIRIYNTLSRQKEDFIPLNPNRVHIYVCGPTVYGHPHIGHAKSYISFDVVVRYFRYKGFTVKYVQNITDVGHLTDDADAGEDKIQKKAREEHLDPMEIAEYFTWSYFDDMYKLRVLRANIYPRATGHIPEQIELVKKLVEKDYAYEVHGNVYFDVSKFKEYGKLSGRKVEELEAGARVEINPDKKHPSDFALWKKAEPGHIMRWNSPWGEGFPGWHIECSVMSMKYLGETFDIHGGGLDNIFPHHECEIAQSEAATGKPFVRYWMHNNMVTVNNMKMSKSLNNFITIKDALQKHDAATIRYFILTSHYRSRLDITDDALDAARIGIDRLLSTIKNLKRSIQTASAVNEAKSSILLDNYRHSFEEAMDDDFNTPRALAVLFDLTKEVNGYLNSGLPLHRPVLESYSEFYQQLAGEVLGLIPGDLMEKVIPEEDQKIEKVIHILIDIRNKLRNDKNFKLADYIRNNLNKIGITLTDKPDDTSFEFDQKN